MIKRISNLIKGFFGLFIGGLERGNPEALLDVEKENLRAQISEFNRGLAAHAALVERLISQVKRLNQEETELKARTQANLEAGNRDTAADLALRLQETGKSHGDLATQLQAAEVRYQELLRARDVSITTAREKIEKLRRDIDELKIQKAMAELNEMAAGMVSNLGGSGDTLHRLSGLVEEERTKAAGRSRVARDSMDASTIQEKHAERRALADIALQDFAKARGIPLAPAAAAAH